MKLICEVKVMVYGIVAKEMESRDGKDNVKYYQAHIRQGKDMTTVSISADAAIQVEKELMKEQYALFALAFGFVVFKWCEQKIKIFRKGLVKHE